MWHKRLPAAGRNNTDVKPLSSFECTTNLVQTGSLFLWINSTEYVISFSWDLCTLVCLSYWLVLFSHKVLFEIHSSCISLSRRIFSYFWNHLCTVFSRIVQVGILSHNISLEHLSLDRGCLERTVSRSVHCSTPHYLDYQITCIPRVVLSSPPGDFRSHVF